MATTGSAHQNDYNEDTHLIGVAQLCSTSDRATNMITVLMMVKEAASKSVEMLFFPEAFSFVGSSGAQTVAMGQSQEGEVITTMRAAAKEHGIWLSLGGFNELATECKDAEQSQRVYNTHIIIDAKGVIVSYYRKIHLFDIDLPGKVTLKESASTAAGSKVVVCDSPVGKLGLTTCYDLRFPELFRELVERGAEVLLVPSAFTVPTGKAHWDVLLRARAIENQAFVIAAAQVGIHNEKRVSYGHSLVVDPWGTVLEDGGEEAPKLIVATIDRNKLLAVRESMPLAQHRANRTCKF